MAARHNDISEACVRYTAHARARLQQRSVPREVVELLYSYGDEARTHNGYILYCSKRSRARIARSRRLNERPEIWRYLGCYLVEGDGGQVVTVGYRYKRIRRDRGARRGGRPIIPVVRHRNG
jgi:hypothetical protein